MWVLWQHTVWCHLWSVTSNALWIYEVLPRSPWNWNAVQKPLAVQLFAATYCELYPLWTSLPSSILRVDVFFFFCAFLWCGSAFLQLYRPAKMSGVWEQWICIKFCFKLGKMAEEIHKMLPEAFGNNALGQMQIYEWFKCFKNRQTVDDVERYLWPSTRTIIESVAKVWEAFLEDWQRTVQVVCNVVRLSYGMCQWILSGELSVRHIASKFVLLLLSNDQKEYCIAVSTELKEQTENDPNFIFTIITRDESWVFGHNPETTQQSSQWKTPTSLRPKKHKKFGAVSSECFFFFDSIVYKEFVPPEQMVNGKFCCSDLRRLRESVWCKQPDKWRNNSTTPGPCIMTVLQLTCISLCYSFWLLWRRQSSPNLPSHWTSPHVKFSYPQGWNWSSRGSVMTALKRSRPNRRMWWRR